MSGYGQDSDLEKMPPGGLRAPPRQAGLAGQHPSAPGAATSQKLTGAGLRATGPRDRTCLLSASTRPGALRLLPEHPFLPTCREDLDARGWDGVDIAIVTGDAYVDHPAFGPVLIARFLEGRGFKVGIISQPDWHSAEPFALLASLASSSGSPRATSTPCSTG